MTVLRVDIFTAAAVRRAAGGTRRPAMDLEACVPRTRAGHPGSGFEPAVRRVGFSRRVAVRRVPAFGCSGLEIGI